MEHGAHGDIMARLRGKARETPRLQKIMEGEYVESFLTTFDRVMRAHEVPENQWSLA